MINGTLLTQIEEGYECDIFISAAQKQMDQLEQDGLVREGTRANVVNNQVVLVTRKDSGTKASGLEDSEGCPEHRTGRRKRSGGQVHQVGA